MDWLDLLAVQGTLKSLLQYHNLKSPILLRSAFFMVQHLHPYMTTGKTIALTKRTFVSKVMSLLFNMLSRLVIVFSPRSKHLFISFQKIKSVTVSIVSPSSFAMKTGCHDLSFMNVEFCFVLFECWVLSQLFHSSLSLSSRGSLVPLHFLS